MTFDEALAILSVSSGASSDEVRRAYLRQVKRHKPERDPEGFRRVRDAFDLVSGEVAWRPVATGHAPPEVSGAVVVEGPAAPGSAVDSSGAPLAGEAVRLVDLTVAASAPSDDPRRDPSDADLEAAVAAARAALSESPADAGRCLALVWALDAAAQYDESDDLVLDAMRRGVAGFDREALLRVPDRLTEEELRTLDASADEWTRGEILHVMADRGDVAGAAAGATRHLESALTDPTIHADTTAASTPWLLLRLHAAGDLGVAQTLLESLRRWLDASRSEALLFHDRQAVLLGIARELGRLPAGFPAPLRTAIAEAALAGDVSESATTLRDYARKTPREAEIAAGFLEARTSFLAGTLADVLRDGARPATRKTNGFGLWPFILVGVLSAWGVPKLLAGSLVTSHRVERAGAVSLAPSQTPTERDQLDVDFAQTCVVPVHHLRNACRSAFALRHAYEEARCDDARSELGVLVRAIDDLPSEVHTSSAVLRGIANRARVRCLLGVRQ